MSVQFAIFENLGSNACEALIQEALTGASTASGWTWLLGYFDDGVVWGRVEAGVWRLSNDVYPEVSPEPRRRHLQELRLFGPDGEALLWRTAGDLKGRVVIDESMDPGQQPARPSSESRLLLGDRVVDARAGFTLVEERDGRRQALPLECSESDLSAGRVVLTVRNYFEEDGNTGMVRIGVTRLVGLEVLGGRARR